jgi:hypothetical protein
LVKPAKERNERERSDFFIHISQYTPDQLVFLDESAYDKRALSRRFGWSIKGARPVQPAFFVRGKRYTIEGALCVKGLLSYSIQEGPMNSEDVLYFCEHILVNIFLFSLNQI